MQFGGRRHQLTLYILPWLPGKRGRGQYCKSRIFRMHVIFVYFVRGGFRTKIKSMQKVQSKAENLQRSVTVRKFHLYERSESPGYQKMSAYEIFWIYSKLSRLA